MRIAILASYPRPGIPPAGGVETSTVRLVRELAERGLDVTVLAPGAPEATADGPVEVRRAPIETRLSLLRGQRRWRQSARLLLYELGPDVVHAQGLLTTGLAMLEAPPRALRVVTAHGNAFRDTSAVSSLRALSRWPLIRRMMRRVARSADAVIGVHPDWRLNVPAEPRAFFHIPPIIADEFYGAIRRPVPGRVLYCGGPRRVKGWDVLLAAWPRVREQVRDANLEVVGWQGPRVRDGSMAFSEWLSPTAMKAAMEQAVVLVMPSRFEVAPLALAEAWAARLPVVATTAGGLASIARGASISVPPDDPEALASGLVGVLRGEIDYSPLVAEGTARARAHRAEAVASAHLAVYEQAG